MAWASTTALAKPSETEGVHEHIGPMELVSHRPAISPPEEHDRAAQPLIVDGRLQLLAIGSVTDDAVLDGQAGVAEPAVHSGDVDQALLPVEASDAQQSEGPAGGAERTVAPGNGSEEREVDGRRDHSVGHRGRTTA